MKVLAIYYTQSGQMRAILESIFSETSCHIDYVAIQPEREFPFPWTATTFFDVMPECFLRIPEPIKPLPELSQNNYDLVVLGYQPWFLSPSLPITNFLKSEWVKLLKDKPVITVVGCRNMWLNAQEAVKEDLRNAGAKLVGNIVFEDHHANIISTLTVIRWMFKGQKEASRNLPAAGVSDEDLRAAKRFGNIIYRHCQNKNWIQLQTALLVAGAVKLKPSLIILERRGVNNFPKFAQRIRAKGLPGDPARRPLTKLFRHLLIVSIFILSPITSLMASIKTYLNRKSLEQEAVYFKGIEYRKGVL